LAASERNQEVRNVKRRITTAVAAVALVAVAAPATALAHECYVTSRSEQGNAGASNSQRWLTIQTAEFFAFAHEFLPVEPLTQAQIDEAVALAAAQGVPTSFTIFIGDKTIGGDAAAYLQNGKAADGKGVDHIFAAHGETLVGIVFAVVG
jgi:hypothetical protein